MSLILSGTDGLSDVDGSASTPAIRGTDANTGIFFPAADTIAFAEGGAEVARFDSNGNFGIGTASPQALLETSKSSSGSTAQIIRLTNPNVAANTGAGIQWNLSTSNAVINGEISLYRDAATSGNMLFKTTNTSGTLTEAMRIDSSGNLLVGSNASYSGTEIMRLTRGGVNWFTGPNSVNGGFDILRDGTTGVFLASGATAWAGLSDETMKDIIEPISDALIKVNSLRCVIGKYKTDEEGIRRSFLIAQDVQKVLPEAINENQNGKLGLQYTDVIPLLVASIKELNAKVDEQKMQIQEQQAIITDLKSRIEALEVKNDTI